jgi:hypothetical protein
VRERVRFVRAFRVIAAGRRVIDAIREDGVRACARDPSILDGSTIGAYFLGWYER